MRGLCRAPAQRRIATLGIERHTRGLNTYHGYPLTSARPAWLAQSLVRRARKTQLQGISTVRFRVTCHGLPPRAIGTTLRARDISVRHFTCGRSLHRSVTASQKFSTPNIDRDVTNL